MIKLAAIIQIAFAFVMIVTDFFRDNLDLALCHGVTSALLLINFLGIVFIVHHLTAKKSIALPLLVIILKYPIIFAVILILSKQSWMTMAGVLMSVLSFVLSFVAAYIFLKVRGQNAF